MTQILQSLINRVLNLNPHYLHYLQDVAGISVAMEFTDLPFKSTIIFHHSFIEVCSDIEAADLVLSGKLVDFICFAAQKSKRQELLQNQRIDFTGDLMVLEKVEAFLSHFNLQILAFLPIAKIKRFLENQIEYWQEEKEILASPILFDHLQDETLKAQQELDRLEARIQILT